MHRALLLDVDPIQLARSRGKQASDFSLAQYVNDRPYAASSLLAVAMADVFSTALRRLYLHNLRLVGSTMHTRAHFAERVRLPGPGASSRASRRGLG